MNKRLLHTIEEVVVEEDGEMTAVEDEVGDDDDDGSSCELIYISVSVDLKFRYLCRMKI